jgi:hypothetical protein
MTTEPDGKTRDWEKLRSDLTGSGAQAPSFQGGEGVNNGPSRLKLADSRMAIDPDGKVKPVSESRAEDKWWCDGEECGEEKQPPHVHCMMHRHAVDIATGRSIF